MNITSPSRSLLVVLVGMALAFGILMVAIPQARAASLTEVQIQAILGLLSSFGADQTIINNVSASLRGTATPGASISNSGNSSISAPGACSFLRSLARGSSGEDVRALQKQLVVHGLLPSTAATGYFGTMTEAALKSWQAKEGIVASGDANSTGWGMVGAKTRARLMVYCGTPQNTTTPPPSSGGTVCTMDAYICPNGSSVGRTGPNCQFVCPSTAPSSSSINFDADFARLDASIGAFSSEAAGMRTSIKQTEE